MDNAVTKRELEALMKKSPSEVREEIKKKVVFYREAWLELAKYLYRVQLCKDYEKWGFETFYDYVEHELQIYEREARWWIQILKKFVLDLGVDEDVLRELPWSKLRYVASVANRKNVKQVLSVVKEKTQDEVIDWAANASKGKADMPEFETMKFSVTKDQKKTIVKAMEEAKKIAQNHSDGHILEMICMDFLADHPDNRKEAFFRMAAKLEQVFHVKLLVVDKDNPDWKKLFEQARDIIRAAQVEV